MDIEALRSELSQLNRNPEDHDALAKLQIILSDFETASLVFNDPYCRQVIQKTKLSLSKHLYKANLCRHIIVSEQAVIKNRQMSAKSIHNINGTFIWCQVQCADLFNIPYASFFKTSVFDLMSKESVGILAARFQGELLSQSKSQIFTFRLKEQPTYLTARCSEVVYSIDGLSFFGILLETRKSKKFGSWFETSIRPIEETNVSQKDAWLSRSELLMPNFALPMKRRSQMQIESPVWSPLLDKSSNMPISPSEFSISPYLKHTSEVSNKCSGVPNITEFNC